MASIAGLAALLYCLQRAAGFDIIGAGLRHTGCDELAKALDILGYKSYHSGKDLPNTHSDWMDITDESTNSEGKKKTGSKALAPLYEFADRLVKDGHNAIVSSPAAFYTLELLRKYPKAKVILTEHDDQNAWFYEAMLATQLALHRDMVKAEYNRLGDCPLPPADADIVECLAGYTDHNTEIREKVPAAQLLAFRVSDGWAPLCEFLGVPVPSEPFPAGKGKDAMSTTVMWAIFGVVLTIICLVIAVQSTGSSTPVAKKAPTKKE